MVAQNVYDLCRSSVSVSAELAKNPTEPPGEVAKRLFPKQSGNKVHNKDEHITATAEDVQRALECGKWGTSKPSELFLKVYHDALGPLAENPLAGMTSPSLMGSCGVLKLTIISTVPDNVRHISNCIARAEKEVFLATNFWQASRPATLVTNALRELSRRAGERGHKVVVKVIYDRGNPKQVLDNHQSVTQKEYTADAVKLPAPEEIPNVDLQVVNYHRPLLGTFHAKYAIIDRKIALIGSHNIQESDNLEMSCHLEGPIVDSFYDMALISWHNALNPPLPTHNSPAALGGWGKTQDPAHPVEGQNISPVQVPAATVMPSNYNLGGPNPGLNQERLPQHTADDPHYDDDIAGEVARVQASLAPVGDETSLEALTKHLNESVTKAATGNGPMWLPGQEFNPYVPTPVEELFPIAMVCRQPSGSPGNKHVYTPQNMAWLSAVRNAQKSVFIQSPTLNSPQMIEELLNAVRRGIDVRCYCSIGYNDAGELLPMQGGTNEMVAHSMYTQLSAAEKRNLHICWYTAKDMIRPIDQKFKQRDCHIKIMIVDSHLGIMGNGNQDAQSWYHSQETNIMLDSPEICTAWIQGLHRNQNTHKYGEVQPEDGVWRDPETGKEVEGSIGIDPGKFSWLKGVVGAVDRVRGVGGF